MLFQRRSLQPAEDLLRMQRRPFRTASGFFHPYRWGCGRCVAPFHQQPQQCFHSTTVTATRAAASLPAQPPSTTPVGASGGFPTADVPSHVQQLYKSAHKGGGTTSMPRPFQERRLRQRRTPAAATEQNASSETEAVATAEAPLFGARSSCAEDAGPVSQRPLTQLQKRQLMFRNKAAFVLTPQALRRVKYLLAQYSPTPAAGVKISTHNDAVGEKPCGIRIGVRRRGCSGYSYTVNYYFTSAKKGSASGASSSSTRKFPGLLEDTVVEQDGVKVVVDADALFYVIGTEMDYVVRNVEEKFIFNNPNKKYSCGCEESFMPFDADDMDDE